MRLVSLVPSLTHMACDFGLRERLVGCTVFCVEPKGLAKSVTMVGGTKDPDLEKIRELRPTHILVNEEENKPEHIALCEKIAPTYVTFPKGPRELPGLLREAGGWLGTREKAEEKARDAEAELRALDESLKRAAWDAKTFLYYIWREPYMVVAQDTYISRMLELVGWENVAPSEPRYPTVTVEEARALAPEVLLLSSEPYPFRKRDAARLREEWPEAPEMLRIDGQLMSWYGTMGIAGLRELRAWVEGRGTELVASS